MLLLLLSAFVLGPLACDCCCSAVYYLFYSNSHTHRTAQRDRETMRNVQFAECLDVTRDGFHAVDIYSLPQHIHGVVPSLSIHHLNFASERNGKKPPLHPRKRRTKVSKQLKCTMPFIRLQLRFQMFSNIQSGRTKLNVPLWPVSFQCLDWNESQSNMR